MLNSILNYIPIPAYPLSFKNIVSLIAILKNIVMFAQIYMC